MITALTEWQTLTDEQKFARLTRAELKRDNAEFFARELSGAAALTRQTAEVERIIALGRELFEVPQSS